MSAPTADRHQTAERLLKSSAKKSYDPAVDIDWDAPLVPDGIWVPEHRVSLYGTELWERLTPEQRVELGKHEACSVASVGLWFEVLLMQRLLKDFYAEDPTSPRAQYALTEVADECRHSQMFARMVDDGRRRALRAAGVDPPARQALLRRQLGPGRPTARSSSPRRCSTACSASRRTTSASSR